MLGLNGHFAAPTTSFWSKRFKILSAKNRYIDLKIVHTLPQNLAENNSMPRQFFWGWFLVLEFLTFSSKKMLSSLSFLVRHELKTFLSPPTRHLPILTFFSFLRLSTLLISSSSHFHFETSLTQRFLLKSERTQRISWMVKSYLNEIRPKLNLNLILYNLYPSNVNKLSLSIFSKTV